MQLLMEGAPGFCEIDRRTDERILITENCFMMLSYRVYAIRTAPIERGAARVSADLKSAARCTSIIVNDS